jgi:O-antigen ligase
MEINKTIIIEDKLLAYSICLFGFFPLLPSRLKGLPVVVLLILASYFFFKKKKRKFPTKEFLRLSPLFFVSFLSIFYTGSFFFPKNKIETSLSLVIVPLAFCLLHYKKIKRSFVFFFIKCFILSTTILSIISLYFYYDNNLFKKGGFRVNSFRKLILEIPIINDHPIYISLYLALSLLFSIAIFSIINNNKKIILIIINLINIFHLLLLSSKGVIIGVLISSVLFLILKLKNKRNKLILVFLIVSMTLLCIMYFPNTSRRFRELGVKSTYEKLEITNSTSLRIFVYKCAIEKIKTRPILGHGWGKGDSSLIDCYKDKSDYLFKQKLNSHNQFLDYYLNGGILLLFILIYFIYHQIIISIKQKKYLLTSTIVFFTIQMLSENILNRQTGIIMFIFMICLFKFQSKVLN